MERGVGPRVLERLWGAGSGCKGMGRRSEGPGSGRRGLGCSGGSGRDGTGSRSERPGAAAEPVLSDLAAGVRL